MNMVEKANGKQTGRPTKYKPEFVQIAGELCREEGYTDENLAVHFKVVKSTIALWKKDYSDFSDAIKKGKDAFDSRVVEQSLLKRAKGYDYEEETSELRKKADGTEEWVVVKKVTKHQPSSDVSKIFWLKNRDPARWSDKKEIDHRIEGITEPLTEEELMKRIKRVQEVGTGIDTRSIGGGDAGSD